MGNALTPVEDVDGLADLRHHAHIVFYENDGGTEPRGNLAKQSCQFDALPIRHPRSRLVDQHEPWGPTSARAKPTRRWSE
ncbi:hypothetical protein ATER59S_03998 [Aquamicrobium terrae]